MTTAHQQQQSNTEIWGTDPVSGAPAVIYPAVMNSDAYARILANPNTPLGQAVRANSNPTARNVAEQSSST